MKLTQTPEPGAWWWVIWRNPSKPEPAFVRTNRLDADDPLVLFYGKSMSLWSFQRNFNPLAFLGPIPWPEGCEADGTITAELEQRARERKK